MTKELSSSYELTVEFEEIHQKTYENREADLSTIFKLFFGHQKISGSVICLF